MNTTESNGLYQMFPMEAWRIAELISPTHRNRSLLIPMLHQVQHDHGFLPREMMERISGTLALPLSEVYGVASFYHQFHFTPRGRVVVRVCTGTACHVRGASALLKGIQDHYDIGVGETAKDLSVTLETVGCVGCCGLAPVATVNDRVVGETGAGNIIQLVSRLEEAA